MYMCIWNMQHQDHVILQHGIIACQFYLDRIYVSYLPLGTKLIESDIDQKWCIPEDNYIYIKKSDMMIIVMNLVGEVLHVSMKHCILTHHFSHVAHLLGYNVLFFNMTNLIFNVFITILTSSAPASSDFSLLTSDCISIIFWCSYNSIRDVNTWRYCGVAQ